MNYFLAFLFSGGICLIGELLYEHTKLTPGHIVSLFVVIGASLSFFNLYEPLLNLFGGGASTLIMNFGHLLYQSAKEGINEGNYLHIFTNMLTSTSGIITFSTIISFIFALLRKPKV